MPRGSTTVVNRPRSDTAAPTRPAPDRRQPGFPRALTPPAILRFAEAVESGNVDRIKLAYPGLTERQKNYWEQQFSLSRPERATILDVKGIGRDPSGATLVEFVMQVSFSDRNTGTPVAVRPSRYRATLRREGARDVLQALSEVTRR